MGCQCVIDQGLARVTFEGDHDFDDEVRALKSGCDGTSVLLDISGSKFVWTAAEVCQLAELFRGGEPQRRCAVVAVGALQYGLARMFVAYTGFQQVSTEVFSELAEAEAWLSQGQAATA